MEALFLSGIILLFLSSFYLVRIAILQLMYVLGKREHPTDSKDFLIVLLLVAISFLLALNM